MHCRVGAQRDGASQLWKLALGSGVQAPLKTQANEVHHQVGDSGHVNTQEKNSW